MENMTEKAYVALNRVVSGKPDVRDLGRLQKVSRVEKALIPKENAHNVLNVLLVEMWTLKVLLGGLRRK